MGRSIRAVISDLNVELRDTNLSQTIWSFDEKYRAIRDAFREAAPYFRTYEVLESVAFSTNIRGYGIPHYARDVHAVEVATSSNKPDWTPLREWWVEAAAETNLLWINKEHGGKSVRIHYTRPIPVPPVEVTAWLDASVTATQGYIPVANTAGFPRDWFPLLPFYLAVGGEGREIVRVDALSATSMTAVHRGMFGTAARANSLQWGLGLIHNSLPVLTPWVVFDEGPFLQFVHNRVKQRLYLTRLADQDTEGSRVVTALASEWGRIADDTLKKNREFSPPRIFQQRFPKRK